MESRLIYLVSLILVFIQRLGEACERIYSFILKQRVADSCYLDHQKYPFTPRCKGWEWLASQTIRLPLRETLFVLNLYSISHNPLSIYYSVLIIPSMISSCEHQNILHRNCTTCGCYIFKQVGVQGIKSDVYSHPGYSITHLRSLRKANIKFQRKTVEFCKQVQVKLLFNLLMSKLGYSKETLALALYFFQHIMGEMNLDKGLHNQQRNEIIHAATCLSLAAKRVERESKHINMSAIKNILQSDLTKKDFSNAELNIFKHFGYELNGFTFLDFLNYYLMKGGLFSNESFRDAQRFEARVNELAWEYLKSGEFIEKDQQSLAAYILFTCRKQFKVNEVWNWHIQHYTKLDLNNIRSIVAQMEVTPLQPYSNLLSNRTPSLASKLQFMNQSPIRRKKEISIQNIDESIDNVRKGYSKLRTSRSGSECRMQSVRSSSSVNRFTFRIE